MDSGRKSKETATRKLKVVVLGLRGIPLVEGGIETHCEKLLPIIAEKSADISVIARKQYVGPREYWYQGVRIIPTWAPNQAGYEAFIHTLLGLFVAKKMKPDLVHIHAVGPSIFTPLARLMGMNVVVTHHGADYERSKWGFWAKMILRVGEYLGMKFASSAIVISKTISDSVSKRFPKQRIHLIPNGVVLPPHDSQVDVDFTLNQFGLKGVPYILAVGRIVPEKGFHDLLEALGGRNDYKVVIAGTAQSPSPYSRALKKLAEEKGALMPGFVSGAPLRHLFRGASLFVLPSMHEGLPIVLLEAMSYNKKILASDISANLNVGLPKSCYFRAGDVRSLREAALRELNDARQVSYAGILKKSYNWRDIAKVTMEVYKSVRKKTHSGHRKTTGM